MTDWRLHPQITLMESDDPPAMEETGPLQFYESAQDALEDPDNFPANERNLPLSPAKKRGRGGKKAVSDSDTYEEGAEANKMELQLRMEFHLFNEGPRIHEHTAAACRWSPTSCAFCFMVIRCAFFGASHRACQFMHWEKDA